MGIYVGIDGGGTKTTCAIGDEKNLLGTGTSGGSNVVRLGEAQARASVQAAILKACVSAKVDPGQVERTCIGVAGASVPQVKDAVRRFVSEVVPGTVVVLGDNEIALESVFGGAPGVVVASGSGSIAYGRNEQGETARAGGHGFAIGDEGSGYWIGRAAVSAALRALDNGKETLMLTQLAYALGAHARDEIVKVANSSPPPDFAAVFPVVTQASEAEDPIAVEVLKRAGGELAQLAATVIRRLWPENTAVRVGMVGGVFQNSSIVRQEFYNALRAIHPKVNVSFSVANPVMGALLIARKDVERAAAKV
jgi:N-acetylglucosamine kinase-like BadF-type ATPase